MPFWFDLRHAPELGVVVARAELQLVVPFLAGDEPGEVILDLVVRVPGTLRLGAGLRQKAELVELWRAPGDGTSRSKPRARVHALPCHQCSHVLRHAKRC